MKHGDKAKAKSAKAASKTSGKSSKAAASKAGRKAGTNLKSSKQEPIKKSSKQEPIKTSAPKTASAPAGGNGKTQARGNGDIGGFSNPLIASAFKRAIKKFPTAFRRLTD